MSTETVADYAAKLARSLRLEDVLINATAVPLPLGLTPSVLPQPVPDVGEAFPQNSDLGATPRQSVQEIVPAGPDGHEAGPDETAPDALGNSLQAARDAIHNSLRMDIGTYAGNLSQSHGLEVGGDNPQNLPPSGIHEPVVASAFDAIGDNELPDFPHASPVANFDLANAVSALRPDQGCDTSPMGAPALADGSILGHGEVVENFVPSLPNLVPSLTSEAQTAVSDVAGAVESIVATALNPIGSAIVTPVGQVAGLVNDVAKAIDVGALLGITGALAPAAFPTSALAAPSADAVTVPSLEGAGFDALAGLLHPSAPAADAVHAAHPAPSGLEDASTFAPIGLDDVIHTGFGEAHAIHALLPHAGSGLI